MRKIKIDHIEEFIDVKKLCEDNLLKISNSKYVKEWRKIKKPAIVRVGLELMGFFDIESIGSRVIGFGSRESELMDKAPDKKQTLKNLETIMNQKPPLIICSIGVSKKNQDIILNYANKTGTPVVILKTRLSFVYSTVGVYILEHFAPQEFVHGSLVIVNGIGVLIIGKSSVGKSEAVIELIQKGHMFVSDDSVIIKRVGNRFVGFPPEITKKIIEARGVGLLNVGSIYGEKAIKDRSDINLVVELKIDSDHQFDRTGNKNYYFDVLDGKIKKVLIPVKSGRTTASLIEVATSVFISKNVGVDAYKEIEERIKKN